MLAHLLKAGLRRWVPERAAVFARFLGKRFWDDNCFEVAGALSYNTIFALVPLSMAVLGIMSAFPVFESWKTTLSQFVFESFIPAYGHELQLKILEFAEKARGLTGAGIFGFVIAALLMMHTVEDVFNRIFRVSRRRRRALRFVVYWTVLTLGPLLLVASLGLSSYVLLSWGYGDGVGFGSLLTFLPILVTWLSTTLAYWIIPNYSVRFRNAVIGGVVATLLFELAKYGFAVYLAHTNYSKVYDAIVVPILLLLFWVYVSWTVVLLGASLAASLSAFRYQPLVARVSQGQEFIYLLSILERIHASSGVGDPLDREALIQQQPNLSEEQIDRFLGHLQACKCVQINEAGEIMALRDLKHVSAFELFHAGAYTLPSGEEIMQLSQRTQQLSAPLLRWASEASSQVLGLLNRPVATLLAPSF